MKCHQLLHDATDLVECLKVTDRWRLLEVVWELLLEMCNEHTELCAPVSQVVQLENIVTHKVIESGNAVANDG